MSRFCSLATLLLSGHLRTFPGGTLTWYATEYDPTQRIFFGYVSIFGDHNDEWGSFALDELEAYRGPFGIGIERDLYFGEKRASEVIREKYPGDCGWG